MQNLGEQTIRDFGAQWTTYTDNDGYYGSVEYLRDVLQPLLATEAIAGARVADIGSGTGRIVNMLLDAGAAHVIAVEPSRAMEVLRANTRARQHAITYAATTGDQFPGHDLDLVISLGVIHHIPDAAAVMRRAMESLKPGGRIFLWLYAREGNGLYLSIALPLRAITRRLPDRMLRGLCHVLNAALGVYVAVAKRLPAFPLKAYSERVLAQLTPAQRFLVIFDQLNPAYAKYYTRAEAEALLHDAGFADIALHHRHGYSWSVMGSKPLGA
jgi:SAM-dependent methyltransferase